MTFAEDELSQKMLQLEKGLQTFRAEVNMKMSIVEQVLNNRNEQFQIQKDLLNREHSLYQMILTHWKNIADMAANGLSLQFAQASEDDDTEIKPALLKSNAALGKRSAAKARRERSKRLLVKKQKVIGEDADGNGVDSSEDFENVDSSLGEDMSADTLEDDEDYDSQGLEKKVFVNFYNASTTCKKGEHSNNLIWKYYLREENGMSAMCKVCEEEGVQHILKIRRGGTWNLYRHLKRHMPNVDFPLEDDCPENEDNGDKVGTERDACSRGEAGAVPDDDEGNDGENETSCAVNKFRKNEDCEEKLPGWMQCLEPFFDFVDFTGKKRTGTPEVIMKCKECSFKKPNNKGIRGRGSHNFARHLKMHPDRNSKYISSLFEQKHNLQKHETVVGDSSTSCPM